MILVTGSRGFIGQHLLHFLNLKGLQVRKLRTFYVDQKIDDADTYYLDRVDDAQFWIKLFEGVDVVVHLAAKTHCTNKLNIKYLNEYRRFNVDLTELIANKAIEFNVNKFIYLSSIKVNGEFTVDSELFQEEDLPRPVDSYGVSKLESENLLLDLFNRESVSLIIIRSPLVYGPGVKGNFLSLIKLANNNFPAPFGGIINLRSLLYIDNLTSFVYTCIMDREIRRSIYMVSDPHPISTTKLFILIRKALNVEPQLFVMPKIGKLCIKVILGINFYNKIYSSLVICWDKANRELGWTPLIPSESGIKYTIEEYLKSVKKNS